MKDNQQAAATALAATMNCQTYDFGDWVLKSRFAKALESGVSRYPIHRSLRFAARVDLQLLFDRIALDLGWIAQRMDQNTMMLESSGAFIMAYGTRKADYCSCYFSIWAESIATADRVGQEILDLVADARIVEPMFSIDWHFLTSKGELESASIEELADDVLFDEAYPELQEGVARFIERYLDARETVLVLQGPPGTGKTRLIRAILGEISRRKRGQAQALYTGDKKALESDQIFVKFITGWDDAFVVEDADHLLKPRAEGNENLHRFLAIADGVIRAQGRKIIFSTNLPNIGDLDDALIRPGRCFARIYARPLSDKEALHLVGRLCADDRQRQEVATASLLGNRREHYSLAEIYKACECWEVPVGNCGDRGSVRLGRRLAKEVQR